MDGELHVFFPENKWGYLSHIDESVFYLGMRIWSAEHFLGELAEKDIAV
jgi:hypothetical protein